MVYMHTSVSSIYTGFRFTNSDAVCSLVCCVYERQSYIFSKLARETTLRKIRSLEFRFYFRWSLRVSYAPLMWFATYRCGRRRNNFMRCGKWEFSTLRKLLKRKSSYDATCLGSRQRMESQKIVAPPSAGKKRKYAHSIQIRSYPLASSYVNHWFFSCFAQFIFVIIERVQFFDIYNGLWKEILIQKIKYYCLFTFLDSKT